MKYHCLGCFCEYDSCQSFVTCRTCGASLASGLDEADRMAAEGRKIILSGDKLWGS